MHAAATFSTHHRSHARAIQGTPDLPDVRTCRQADLKRKHVRNLETQDRRGATVGVGDMVTLDESHAKGKAATVKHVMKGSLFLHSKCAAPPLALSYSWDLPMSLLGLRGHSGSASKH